MSAPVFATFGCRLNAYETEAMRELAVAAGVADAVIVNTCAVTAEAVRQARQRIRKLRAENPDAPLIVTGCAAQTEPETFAAMPEVDLVIGNLAKMRAETWAGLAAERREIAPSPNPSHEGRGIPLRERENDRAVETKRPPVPGRGGLMEGLRDGKRAQPPRRTFDPAAAEKIRVDDIMSATETAGHLIDGFGTRARAYVQVQNGCDHRCTFCIIPYGRGNARSVPAGVVVEQIKRLVDRGFNEVVLTGVDLTSWGGDLPGAPPLGDLVRRILTLVPDLPRLRLSSIDGIEADPALIDAIAGDRRLMPHLHLSLQAGDDLILKRMKRRHLRDDSIRFCDAIRAARPEVVFGADLIAGFPTETEAMFDQTLDLVEACGLTYLHVFPFSPRQGTPAARMPQLDRSVIKERAARLRALGQRRLSGYLESQIGRSHRVLMEKERLGRTETFAEVALSASAPVGSLRETTILGVRDGRLAA